MKKIGILSMQRVVNHGSFLQAYGLKKTIEKSISKCGKCEFIDIPLKSEPVTYRVLKLKDYINIVKAHIHNKLGEKQVYNEMMLPYCISLYNKIYQKSINRYLNITSKYNFSTNYQNVVIGSDEVFNCTQGEVAPWGDTMLLFGDTVQSPNIISYAASFGFTTSQRLKEFNLYSKVKENLKNFNAISIRDKNSLDLVKELADTKPYKHLDPVLIYDYTKEIKRVRRKNYIALYQYFDRINEPEFIAQIKAFAKKKDLDIVSIFGYSYWADENIVTSPFKAMSYIKNADYVVSDTFHGCVMSIKFNRPFAAIVRDSNQNKLTDLLETFHLESQICTQDSDFSKIVTSKLDWENVNNIISKEKASSIEYLKKHIKVEN